MLGYGVKETTTTTGTGTLTLSSVSGFPRFSQAFSTGDMVEYSILTSAGEPLECGIGTVAASNTLERTYPLVTYSGGTYDNTTPSALSLSAGTYTVICTGSPGSGAPFIQSMWSGATNKSISSAHITGNHSSTHPMTANRLEVVPFQLIANRPMAGLMTRVSVSGGTSGTLGLYRCGSGGLPTDLLQSGSISCSSSGTLQSITFSAYYPPGWYYVALVCDGAPTINCPGTTPGASPLGTDTNNQNIVALYTANGSTTLPNPFSGSTTNIVNSNAFAGISVLLA